MLTKVHSGGLILAVAWLLVLSTFLPQTQAVSLAQDPPPETWPDRWAADPLEDLPHLAPGEPSPEAASAGAAEAVPAWSRLVFQSLRDGNWEIYRANADGSNQVRLTHGTGSDIQPRLNRGCTRIVFASNRSGSYEIYTMKLDGSGVKRMTSNNSHDVRPSWSPDGTRIAFEAYRNGQGEIYVMNADGSNQKRLTQNSVWDGEPVWSPDGSRIAFTSYRNSVYRIWRMNADGSNQVRLSDQPYSELAAWSPDGSLIAFDADGNSDGWWDLWLMNADGTNEHQVYDPPEAQTDAWAGSWSPDGRYLAFTRISWIQYHGSWYWTAAYLDAWDRTTGAIVRLSDSGVDWMPDWQTADLAAPMSRVSALPSTSPSPIPVSWSGQDSGPAGIGSYDVQVREGAGGSWTDWLIGASGTSGAYPGAGGHTYYFRSRARDNAGNVEAWPPDADASTTVEALAPATVVNALAPYSRGEITVRWGGNDPGGSGIAAYDVQVRDGAAGTWTDWQAGTGDVQAGFSGEGGHTYYFRSRGTDGAGNVELWPPDDGDASTTFYVWRMTGTLRDNRETPVTGGAVSLSPEALAVIPSDFDGAYTAYEATVSGEYVATWSKAGYGGLPATTFSGATDAQADMILPPAGNVVQNWGFDTGSLAPEWLVEGAIPPAITSDRSHTGGFSAVLGQPTGMFDPWVNLSNSTFHSSRPSVAVDGSGAVHVVWIEYASYYVDVLYARREPGGAWSAPVSVSGSLQVDQLVWFLLQLAVEADGTAHVAWPCGVPGSEDVFYNRRAPDGTWSGPVNVSQNGHLSQGLDMALGIDGALHLVWQDNPEDDIMYARRAPDGTWSAVDNVSQTAGDSHDALVAAGPDGTVHAVWTDQTPGNREVFYAWRASDGTWFAPVNLSNNPGWSAPGGLAAAGDGSVHVAWSDNSVGYPPAIYYALRSAGGEWSDPVQVADPAHGGGSLKLALGPDGSVHLVWGWDRVRYARRAADGMWSPPEEGGSAPHCEWHELRVDSSGTAHTVCSGWLNAEDVFYLRRTVDGAWSGWINVSNTAEYTTFPRLALDATDRLHVVWQEGPQYGSHEILYAQSTGVEESGESIVSQELTVPPAGTAPTLSFWYRLEGSPAPGGSWFTAQVDDGQTNTDLFTATSVCDWTHRWVDLTPWAGQAVTLRFLVHQTEGKPAAGATLEEVSVGAASPDLWVTKTATAPFLPPGEPVEFTLTYGNRGGVGASQVVLTDLLPPGLEFVSADPPPTTVTPHLTWAVGDLPAWSGPATIRLIATVAPDVPVWTTLTNTVEIGSASAELETLNNEAQAAVWIGWRILLPLVVRGY